jgi:hypothetical protein
VFLLASECSIFKNFFARDWPLLSPSHGFNFLGLCMIALGNNILGNLNKEATSQESLGLAFWRLVIGAGIVIFILGWVNVIATYVFRDSYIGVTARQVRSRGAVAISDREVAIEADKTAASIVSSFPTGSSVYSQPSYAPHTFGANAVHKSPVKQFFRNARHSILPSYSRGNRSPPDPMPYPASPIKSPTSPKKAGHDEIKSPTMNISAPLNVNPQFAHLIKPELAHHPSNRRPDGSF